MVQKMLKANLQQEPIPQVSLLFWLDHDGYVTVSGRLSKEASGRAGGNFDHRSVMDVIYELEGGDAAYAYEVAAIAMIDSVHAMSREDAEAFYQAADKDTLLHLRSLGLCGGVGEKESRGLFDYVPRRQPKKF